MGLDISVYRDLHPTDREDDSNLYVNSQDFPLQADGLETGHYLATSLYDFWGGSYSGYNWWRNRLSETMLGVCAEQVWESPDAFKGKPFVELIHFTDCDGVIGPKTSAKLAADFEEHLGKLPNSESEDDTGFRKKYEQWLSAFRLAAQVNGVVRFH
jgi:hypothetical protein